MKYLSKTVFVTAVVTAMSSPAFADKQNSENCAAELSQTGKTIYEAVAPVSYTHLTLPTTPYV